MGWIIGCPPIAQLTSTQGLVLLWNPGANVDALWPTATAFNIFCARQLPLTEGIFTVVHVVGFSAFIVVLCVTSDHAPANQVFTRFDDYGGLGQHGALGPSSASRRPCGASSAGPDASAHTSKELKDASPSALMWGCRLQCACWWSSRPASASVQTGKMTFLGLTTPPTQTGIPIIQVLYNSRDSIPATAFMTTVLIVLDLVAVITCIASTSR